MLSISVEYYILIFYISLKDQNTLKHINFKFAKMAKLAFGRFISTHFGTVGSLSMISINQPLFPKKTEPLYPNPKNLFGNGR